MSNNPFLSKLKKKTSVPSKEAEEPQNKQKKQKTNQKWKPIPMSSFTARDFSNFGVMSVEELDDYDLEVKDGKTVVVEKKKRKMEEKDEKEDSQETKPEKQAKKKQKKKEKKTSTKTEEVESDEILDELLAKKQVTSTVDPTEVIDLPNWTGLNIHPAILKALKELNFTEPTPIQSHSIPAAMHRKDIVGAAQTGSGKTLAFGIPIINSLLNNANHESGLKALIISPTRELALQITQHLTAIAKYTSIQIVPIVGGMSQFKQMRLINAQPEIIVATPGRLWELLSQSEKGTFLWNLQTLQFLVLDEADRMVETGHFSELEHILKALPKYKPNKKKQEEEEEGMDGEVLELPENLKEFEEEEIVLKKPRQTFVFSATLTMEHLKISKNAVQKSGNAKNKQTWSSIDRVLDILDFQSKIEVIDLSKTAVLAESLSLAKIDCVDEEKDYFLYGFLNQFPGRTIVFVNAISNIRRILPLFALLQVPVWGLHSGMQQRQRLKNLDRFKASSNGVLIATDVAARGIDIPNIEHVVHYQVPFHADVFVHRSGRTARAKSSGFSLVLLSPKDAPAFKKISTTLKEEIPNYPFDMTLLPSIKQRVDLARKIEGIMHQTSHGAKDQKWEKQVAAAFDIDIENDDDEDTAFNKKNTSNQVSRLKLQLHEMLSKSLVGKGARSQPLPLSELAQPQKTTAITALKSKLNKGNKK